MNFIRLNLTEGGKLLVDKTLIIYAIDWGKYTSITLSDTRQFDVAEQIEEIQNLLKD